MCRRKISGQRPRMIVSWSPKRVVSLVTVGVQVSEILWHDNRMTQCLPNNQLSYLAPVEGGKMDEDIVNDPELGPIGAKSGIPIALKRPAPTAQERQKLIERSHRNTTKRDMEMRTKQTDHLEAKAMSGDSPIETELTKATKVTRRRSEDLQKYLGRIVDGIDSMDDDTWASLSSDAQTWANELTTARKEGGELPDFADREGGEEEPADDDAAEAADENGVDQGETDEASADDGDAQPTEDDVSTATEPAEARPRRVRSGKEATPAPTRRRAAAEKPVARNTARTTKAAPAKAPAKAAGRAKVAAPKEKRVRDGSKMEAIEKLLKRKNGCTRKEVLEATGWKAVSMQAMAEALGLKLTQQRDPGEPTVYYGE